MSSLPLVSSERLEKLSARLDPMLEEEVVESCSNSNISVVSEGRPGKRPKITSFFSKRTSAQIDLTDASPELVERNQRLTMSLEKAEYDKKKLEEQVSKLSSDLKHVKEIVQFQKKELNELSSHKKKSLVALEQLVRQLDDLAYRDTQKEIADKQFQIGKVVRKGGSGDVWRNGHRLFLLEERSYNLEFKKETTKGLKEELSKLRSRYKKLSPSDPDRLELDLHITELEETVKINTQKLRKGDLELNAAVEQYKIDKLLLLKQISRIDEQQRSRFAERPVLHNKYVLRNLLGKGGFSEVWRAYDLTSMRSVAVKIHEVKSRWSEGEREKYIRHAQREYSIHKTLKHEHIVSLYDAFPMKGGDSFATVLEYCEGIDLGFLLRRQKTLVEREARCLLLQILSGLRYLNHDKSNPERQIVIHYDLKPANILIDKKGGVKISDFGLSKVIQKSSKKDIELTSQFTGTYYYLPPECFLTESEQVDEILGTQEKKEKFTPRISSKVDVWSLGVIFYQMLFGVRPFGEGMSQDVLLREQTMLKAHNVEFPEKTEVSVSEGARAFIKRCLTYRQDLRPGVLEISEDPYLRQKKI